MMVLGIDPGSSGKAVSALICISPAPLSLLMEGSPHLVVDLFIERG